MNPDSTIDSPSMGSHSHDGRSAPLTRVAESYSRLSSDPRFSGWTILRPHPLCVTLRKEANIVVIAPSEIWDRDRDVLRPFADRFAAGTALVVLLGIPHEPDLIQALNRGVGATVSAEPSTDELFVAVHAAFELLETKARAERRGQWLNRYRYELGELIEIAKAITTERELDKLLGLILEKSRFITGADAGSIYVVEGDDPDPLRRMLRFKLSQNDSVAFDPKEFSVPLSSRSMAGYVALHRKILSIEDVYDLPADAPYGFDRSFDARMGYRTQSILGAPLLSRAGDVVGVIQLINKKRDPEKKLLSLEDVDRQVIPFDDRSEELVSTLAAQAGISLENAILYAEIQRMLEGFVRASVEAIEQRDPTTSGHSRRVADLTVGLAKAVARTSSGPYAEASFTRDDLRELEYASLLHDFGKIGVREEVLVKAKKLHPHELEAIRARFEFAIQALELDALRRKLWLLEKGAPADEILAVEREYERRRAEFDSGFAAICAANEPTILKGGDFERIEAVARETFTDVSGNVHPLLHPHEVASLSVTRGSLTTGEIEEIRSHVTHTFEFLTQIPWGKQFRRVATIAGAHHERLNGTGYPNRLHAEEIPLQSKMMAVSDIFDALTASDRPYKKAVPLEKALGILEFEVRDQHIDGELVRIFVEAEVWATVTDAPPRSWALGRPT